MKSFEVLRKARMLIERPGSFCQGAYAKNDSGRSIRPESTAAYRRDAMGALMSATMFMPGMFGQARTYLDRIAMAQGTDVTSIGDKKGQRAILDLYDQAIAIAENEER